MYRRYPLHVKDLGVSPQFSAEKNARQQIEIMKFKLFLVTCQVCLMFCKLTPSDLN